jgi:hypothetical protein
VPLDPDGAPAGYYYQSGATAYLLDEAGTYSLAGASTPTIDPAGTYSGPGASAPAPVAPGTCIPIRGATSAAAQVVDPVGAHSGAGASAPTTAGAYVFNTAKSQYGIDRLFLTYDNNAPLNEVLSFNSVTAVANVFGEDSQEATLATEFFSGYAGSPANMPFARPPVGGGRARLFGGNIRALTLAQFQAISGTLSLTSQSGQLVTCRLPG